MSRSAVVPVATGDLTGEQAGGRAAGRPRFYREILLIALCYGAYSLVRDLVPRNHTAALSRGHDILHLERLLHLNVELSINRLFTDERWLGVSANYYYSSLHFIITIGVLVWLYVRHADRYVFYRRLIFATTVLALVGFWLYPLAPPRMIPGFVDTVLSFHTTGLYESSASPVASVSNQYAAMPSLHTGWSLWCAIAIADLARPSRFRWLAYCYPAATVFVILGTANHYVLDAIGGVVTLGVGYAATRTVRVVVPRLGPVSRVFSTDTGGSTVN
ncbi:phosphatase PAP2 family protein [Actinoallomurus soli]|uniref:phosphatase PAP2 family protein n=1 Tax=Actinoallomurus soli TaxID=2952535 RepID=UPI002091FB4A|nr:phosphatase PAP2 family protein [Actinoallomurus soli]MCO5967037.1 phosphatase PAP2 family protein [Actinoallomurus soli]